MRWNMRTVLVSARQTHHGEYILAAYPLVFCLSYDQLTNPVSPYTKFLFFSLCNCVSLSFDSTSLKISSSRAVFASILFKEIMLYYVCISMIYFSSPVSSCLSSLSPSSSWVSESEAREEIEQMFICSPWSSFYDIL